MISGLSNFDDNLRIFLFPVSNERARLYKEQINLYSRAAQAILDTEIAVEKIIAPQMMR